MSIIAKANAAAPANLANTDVQVFADALDPTKPCLLALPGSGVLDGQPFDLIATGYIESVAGMSAAVRLLAGNSADITKDTVLGVSGEAACPAGERVTWSIKAHLLYIVETGTITGEVSSNTAGVYSGPVTLTAPVVGIPTGTDPVLAFGVAVEVTPPAAPPPEEPPAQEPQTQPEPQAEAEPPYIPPPPVGGSPVPLPPVTQELVTMVLFAIAE